MTTSFVYLTLLVMAIAGSCADKTTEATCGAGCEWANTTKGSCGGAGAVCAGTQTCANAEESVCQANTGCIWIAASDEKCAGTATCEGQTSEGSCTAIGCSYENADTATCVGAPTTCDGTSADNCKLESCTWTPAAISASCEGNLNCFTARSEAGCNAIGICEWEVPKPEGCYVMDEEFTCDVFNSPDFTEDGLDLGPPYCVWAPGCTYSGSLGTCTGSKPLTCVGATRAACSILGCESEAKIVCSVPSCSDFNEEGPCLSTPGCDYNSESGVCSSSSEVTSAICSSKTNYGDCWTAGCSPSYLKECIVPGDCTYHSESIGCGAAGCIWDGTENKCSGTVTVPQGNCAGKSSENDCRVAGCYYSNVYECKGTANVTTCSQMESGGAFCDAVGCTSTGYVKGSCSGNLDFNAGSSATNEDECEALGQAFWWDEGNDGECHQNQNFDGKTCSNFAANNEICYSVGCTWKAAVAQGCSRTPENGENGHSGTVCSTLTSDGQTVCEGNQCDWIEAGAKVCTNTPSTPSKTCQELEGESACGSIGGCTYTGAVATSKCEGTNAGQCVGSTSTSCTGVFGCSFTPACAVLGTKETCIARDECAWTQVGMCTDEKPVQKPSSAVVIYFPALLVFLFALFL